MTNKIHVNVTEKRNISVDHVYVTIKLTFEHKKLNELLKKASSQRQQLIDILLKNEITKDQITINKMDISTIYIPSKERSAFSKKGIAGYKFNQNLVIDFPYDEDFMNRLLRKITHSLCEISLEIKFDCQHKDEILEAMIEQLGTKARKKAEQLLIGTNACLDTLSDVSYDVDPSNFLFTHSDSHIHYQLKEFLSPYLEDDECDEDFFTESKPEDITLEIHATYSWVIKQK